MLQITGNRLEHIEKELYRKNEAVKDMVMAIVVGNSVEPDFQKTIVNLLAPNITEVVRVDGAKIPMIRHNVYFTKASFSTDVAEFGTKVGKFTLMASEGYNATAFKHEVEEILKAENDGIDILKYDAQQVEAYANVYQNRMKPAKRLIALLTGHSEALEIPTEKTSTSLYTSDWGALRGENNEDVLNPVKTEFANTSHYRGIRGTVLKVEDIFNSAELIKSYTTYSGEEIVALASARTIYELGSLYGNLANIDDKLIDGTPVRNVAGVKFVEIPNMTDDFIVFYDGGAKDLLLHCVNKSESQRGLALITEKDLKSIESPSDVNGMKLRVFPEEFILFAREKVVILDIKRQGLTTPANKVGWMSSDGATKLNDYVKSLAKTFAIESK